MDIGISSNFERYLFYLFGEDSKELASKMSTFNETDRLSVDQDQLETAREDFLAAATTRQGRASAYPRAGQDRYEGGLIPIYILY